MAEDVSHEEIENRLAMVRRALAIPATYANLVNVAVTAANVRLTFGEQLGSEQPYFQVAASIPVETAYSLLWVLKERLEAQFGPEGLPPDAG